MKVFTLCLRLLSWLFLSVKILNKKKQKLIQEPHRKLLKRESVQSDWLTPWIETISLLVGV